MGNMKKLLYAIRKWLIDILGGVPMCFYDSMASLANHFNEQINDYRIAIREICRRSDNTYYDWCCDQCACDCDKRNGWCAAFAPKEFTKVYSHD
jgi:hypothetical protein